MCKHVQAGIQDDDCMHPVALSHNDRTFVYQLRFLTNAILAPFGLEPQASGQMKPGWHFVQL
jgi:hypothetical protein